VPCRCTARRALRASEARGLQWRGGGGEAAWRQRRTVAARANRASGGGRERELRSEGERGGEGRGCSGVYIGGRGASERGNV
jgi:hypothetical protein